MQRRKKSTMGIFPLFSFLALIIGLSGAIILSQGNTNTVQYAAGDIYVSASGSDSNSGSQSSPYKTIQKGVDSASAGTTVHVAPGSYSAFTINKSGSSGSPITIISDTKWGAKITGSGNGSTKSYIIRNNGSYIHIIGFDLTSQGVTDGIDNFGSNNLVQGNKVHDMTNINCSGTPGGQGIGDDTGSNNTYDGNVLTAIGGTSKCDYIHAIYVDDTGDVVSNNISYNNAGNGIYTNHGTGKVIFTNNLSFNNREYGIGVNGSGSGNVVQNNILIGNGIAGIKTWSGTSGTQITNNILYNNASNYILDGSASQSNNLTSDPKLVNYKADGTGDYHLAAGSPAIGAGVSANAPATDFDGNARSGAIDIGPYKYGSSGGVTPSITSGSATNTPVPSGGNGSVNVSLTLLLHALGKAGDNVSPGGTGGNMSPAHTTRSTTIKLTCTDNSVITQQGSVSYNSANGNFTGNISLSNVPNGQYTINIKTDGFLSNTAAGIYTVNGAQTITVPSLSETTGDINNDNQLDILDYNMIVSCYGSKSTSSSCTAPITATSPGADINDDGVISGIDYNFFIRELSKQSGN